MIYDIPKPQIIDSFSVEDIRRIRDWHYEVLKDATREERRAFYLSGQNELFKGRKKPKVVRPGDFEKFSKKCSDYGGERGE